MPDQLEFGLDTFGDITAGPDGQPLPAHHVLRNIVEEAVLADKLGLHFIGIGEHHRDDFAVPAPDMVLAAIAARTERIRLGSAVTVLSSDDPVRVYERFATLDGLSNGRAEVIVGRGSFIESFPLFGFQLQDYELLFEERLALFTELLKEKPVTWNGRTRAALEDQPVYPRTASGKLPTWVAVGGTPQSVVRAAHFGLPLMVAIIGGNPMHFQPLVHLYRSSLAERGKAPLPVGIHSPGYVAPTDEQAVEELYPYYEVMHNRIGRERGWPPLTRSGFQQLLGPHGALCVGAPDTVARKIAGTLKVLGASRFDLKYSNGAMPHAMLLGSIRLYATEVVPRVRELLR
jgi:probable LLM family oxidoreductase